MNEAKIFLLILGGNCYPMTIPEVDCLSVSSDNKIEFQAKSLEEYHEPLFIYLPYSRFDVTVIL